MKKPRFIFILVAGLLNLLLMNCSKKVTPAISQNKSIHKLVSLSKSSCFGKCAVYNLTVYNDGLVILEGKANLDKLGVYHTMLNTLEFDKLNHTIQSLNWKIYKPAYLRNIPDLPMSTITYYNIADTGRITIKSNSTLPAELEDLHKVLMELTNGKNWIQALKEKEVNAKDIISNELQIDMDSTLSTSRMEEIFKPYDFKMVNRISQYMNYYLFTFDKDKISPVEMVVLVRRTKGVRLVQFNKKLSPRDDF